MLQIICAKSKKNDKLYYALKNSRGKVITFDVMLMCDLLGCTPREIYLLNEGETIEFNIERS